MSSLKNILPIKDPFRIVSIEAYQAVISRILLKKIGQTIRLHEAVYDIIVGYLLLPISHINKCLGEYFEQWLSDLVRESVTVIYSPDNTITKLRVIHKEYNGPNGYTVMDVTSSSDKKFKNPSGYRLSNYEYQLSTNRILGIFTRRLINYTVDNYGIAKDRIKKMKLIAVDVTSDDDSSDDFENTSHDEANAGHQ